MDEKIFLDINGARQGLFLKSENAQNPVLLFLHGGPGSPEIAFDASSPSGLEKLFTVCWWEQRGSGISYSNKSTREEMTAEQIIADTVAVTEYLCKRFSKDKIYLMGHSWGSFLGVLTVQRRPELYHAYIGIGQVVQQDRSERLAYGYMLEEFEKANDKAMLKRLKRFEINNGEEICMQYLSVRSTGLNKLGSGVMRSMKSMLGCLAIVLKFKGYTFSEKIGFARGSIFSLSCLWDFVLKANLFEQVQSLQIPVYILHGKYDYQVSYTLSRSFAERLKAPVKGFYTFESSAHSPCFEEAVKMREIMQNDVLQGKTELADVL